MNELITEGKIKSRKEWDAIQVKFLSKHKYFTEYSNSVREPQKHLKLKEIIKRFETDEY
jgi:hypothetical protein